MLIFFEKLGKQRFTKQKGVLYEASAEIPAVSKIFGVVHQVSGSKRVTGSRRGSLNSSRTVFLLSSFKGARTNRFVRYISLDMTAPTRFAQTFRQNCVAKNSMYSCEQRQGIESRNNNSDS